MRAFFAARPVLWMVCAVAALAGCRSLIPAVPISMPGSTPTITEDQLRADILETANAFAAAVTAASDDISSATQDRTMRRRALLWKVRMVPLAEQAALSEPREAYVELRVLCAAQRQYLTDGAGAALFGEHQPIARSAAEKIEEGVRTYAQRILPANRLGALDEEVDRLARARPIAGEFVAVGVQRAFTDVAPGSRFDWILTLPLSPFRAFEGVESGAQAIHEFNATARQLGDMAARLPEQTRWQMELFLYDLEDRETVMRGLESFERLTQTAEQLPSATREELARLFADSTAAQQELRTTLDALREASASIDATLGNARPFAETLERVAGRAEEAGATWNALITGLRARGDGDQPSSGRPFDITEYERTANGVRDAAIELRAMLDALRAAESSLADTLLWRGLVLIAAFFALLVVYRVLTTRWRSRGG